MMYLLYNMDGIENMKALNTSDAREKLAEVLNRVAYGKDRVRITRHGKEIAAVVPIEDLELIERLEDQIDLEEAEKALTEAREKGTIPLADIREELGL